MLAEVWRLVSRADPLKIVQSPDHPHGAEIEPHERAPFRRSVIGMYRAETLRAGGGPCVLDDPVDPGADMIGVPSDVR